MFDPGKKKINQTMDMWPSWICNPRRCSYPVKQMGPKSDGLGHVKVSAQKSGKVIYLLSPSPAINENFVPRMLSSSLRKIMM